MLREYKDHKQTLAKNIQFDGTVRGERFNVCRLIKFSTLGRFLPDIIQMVNIHLGTATYDEVEKAEKVTIEAALGLIGGTMGLFTGFSILSGVEIVYYLAKFFMSLRLFGADYQKSSKNHLKA